MIDIKSQSDLHTLLLTIASNAYFQPPASKQINYPCVVYSRDDIDIKYSNNKPYSATTRYLVTIIDPNPNSNLIPKMLALPMCSFNRHYTKDNLNHDVYTLYY